MSHTNAATLNDPAVPLSQGCEQQPQTPATAGVLIKQEEDRLTTIKQEACGDLKYGIVEYLKTTSLQDSAQATQLSFVIRPDIPNAKKAFYQAVATSFICKECYRRGHTNCLISIDREDQRCVSCISLRMPTGKCEAVQYARATAEFLDLPRLAEDARLQVSGYAELQISKRRNAFMLDPATPIVDFDTALKIKAKHMDIPSIATRNSPKVVKLSHFSPYRGSGKRATRQRLKVGGSALRPIEIVDDMDEEDDDVITMDAIEWARAHADTAHARSATSQSQSSPESTILVRPDTGVSGAGSDREELDTIFTDQGV